MAQSVDLDEATKRPMRYWDQDGLPGLVLGLVLIVSGGVFLVGRALPRGSSISQVYAIVAPILWGGSCLAMRWGLKKLKERITFPRGGYVALREPTLTYRASALAAVLLVGAGMALLNAKGGLPQWRWMAAPGFATFFAVALLVGGLQYRLPHMLWLAAFSLVLGAWMYRIRAGVEGGLWVMLWLGGAMALTGAVRLRSFLKANPRTEDAEA
jgi:hypothetical protein